MEGLRELRLAELCGAAERPAGLAAAGGVPGVRGDAVKPAWHRLALIVAATAFVFGLVEIGRWLGWPLMLLVAFFGVALAAGLAEDWGRVDSSDRQPRQISGSGDPGAQAAARRERRHGPLRLG